MSLRGVKRRSNLITPSVIPVKLLPAKTGNGNSVFFYIKVPFPGAV